MKSSAVPHDPPSRATVTASVDTNGRSLFRCPNCGGRVRALGARRYRPRLINGAVFRVRKCRECGRLTVYRECPLVASR